MAYTREQAEVYGNLGREAFQKRNRELLASFNGAQVIKAVVAWTRLHKQEQILKHITESDPDLNFFADHLEQGLLTLFDAGKIQPEASITELGEAALKAMRQRTGIYPNGVAPAAEAKPLTEEEQLEAEVIADFNSLPSDKMRQKRNASKTYNETFIRLANENRLESRVTSAVLAGA
jgi:hypothetical protein